MSHDLTTAPVEFSKQLRTSRTPLPAIPAGYATDLEHGFDSERARLKNIRGTVKKYEAILANKRERNPSDPDVSALSEQLRLLQHECINAEEQLLPWHHDEQFLSPKSLLCTPLFSVARCGARAPQVVVQIPHSSTCELTYQGPELRQSDGLVFMALLHLAKDYLPGRLVHFSPQELIESFGHQYGGSERQQLRQTIMRLQEGFLRGADFRVQLIGMFRYPRYGDWAIKLDEHVMRLFEGVQAVWMGRQLRTCLPQGLATWLLGYVRSQGILNPTSIELLQSRCGSPAKLKHFADSLRDALSVLQDCEVVAPGWRISRGKVMWKKGKNG